MPTSLFNEMDRGTNVGGVCFDQEERTLALAFELSLLRTDGQPGTVNGTNNDSDSLQVTPAVFEEARSKKSQNMTECVPVPSSEHVAEIVGRQGKCVFDSSQENVSFRAFFFFLLAICLAPRLGTVVINFGMAARLEGK